MKRSLILLAAAVTLLVGGSVAQAGWGSLGYGGYQPWWNVFASRNKGMTCEEERLQRFWHDYYDAMRRYYDLLDNIDWVAYYKNHGYQINAQGGGPGGCGPCGGAPTRIQYAPVFVSPNMQWAVPNSGVSGAPNGPMAPNPAMFNAMSGGFPGFQQMPHPQQQMPYPMYPPNYPYPYPHP